MTAPAIARRRGPIDPRLWRWSRSTRRYLALSVVLSVVSVGSIVVAAVLLGSVVGGVVTDPGRRTLGAWATELVGLVAAVGIRVGAAWLQGRFGHRAATRVIVELETAALAGATRLPLRELETRSAEFATVLTRGVADIRPYLAEYLPALIAAVVVPPVVLAVILTQDVTSAVIIAVTLPLIPVFMILIGLLTKGKAEQTLSATSTLSAQLLDLLAGLPTLRALGREKAPERRVAELGREHRRTAMSALRVAFLSSAVLELLATLCVALVAVSIGLRLVFGDMGLVPGLVALILAPEVYQPLRAVGAKFHAAQDGTAAADKAFEVVGRGEPGAPTRRRRVATACRLAPRIPAHCPHGRTGCNLCGKSNAVREAEESRPPRRCNGVVEVAGVGVRARDGLAPAAADAVFRPGMVTVLTGANGSGKSTLLQAILGLVPLGTGRVTVDGIDLATLDLDWWWDHVGWLPQRPVLVPGTLRENLELLGPVGADQRVLTKACAATGFDAVLDELPDGWETTIGTGGVGLSLGQRQRLALTRMLVAGKPIVLLDEPTAHLDPESESAVLAVLSDYAAGGATVVIVGHRPSVLAAADEIVVVRSDAHH